MNKYRLILREEDQEKRFSIFRLDESLYYETSPEKQEREWFVNSSNGRVSLEIYNSGSRRIRVGVNSEEEKHHLASLFIHWGFKIKLKDSCESPTHRLRRRYFTTKDIRNLNPYPITTVLYPRSNGFYIYLPKKKTKEFLDRIKELSKDYGYKTIYEDIPVTRRYLRNKNETLNYFLM